MDPARFGGFSGTLDCSRNHRRIHRQGSKRSSAGLLLLVGRRNGASHTGRGEVLGGEICQDAELLISGYVAPEEGCVAMSRSTWLHSRSGSSSARAWPFISHLRSSRSFWASVLIFAALLLSSQLTLAQSVFPQRGPKLVGILAVGAAEQAIPLRCPATATRPSWVGLPTTLATIRAPGRRGSSAKAMSGASKAASWSAQARWETRPKGHPWRCPPTATPPSSAGGATTARRIG
jgi:hypothetical protein